MRREGESEVENGRPPAVRKAVPPRPPQGARPSRPPRRRTPTASAPPHLIPALPVFLEPSRVPEF